MMGRSRVRRWRLWLFQACGSWSLRLVSRICVICVICGFVCFTIVASDDQCLTCHKNYGRYFTTAHHFTSRVASKESILGKFDDVLKTSEPELFYRLEARNNGFFQVGILGTPPDSVSIAERFDFVIGSGRKGQTYLYWGKDDQLFQLPVSYWTEVASWVNSPGYGDRTLDFSRPVVPRCLECHASYFEAVNDAAAANRYRRTDYVLGVSCERCHGPGQKHVELNAPGAPKPADQSIVNPAKLARDWRLEVWSLCDGG